MKYYLAPMEGITTYIYRNAYAKYFGDIDKYFTPFIASTGLNTKELYEILPEHNEGLLVTPQILTNRVDDFLAIAHRMSEFGYDTVNLNLGCPSGTVVSKKRGSGFLGVPKDLDLFLEQIFDKCPMKISIKTRIGISSEEEWAGILEIYKKYPLEELIIHPRFQKQQYAGVPHLNSFRFAQEQMEIPLCYNGDIVSYDSMKHIQSSLLDFSCAMIGRGLLSYPDLIGRLNGQAPCSKETLRAFHDELFDKYHQRLSGETPTLFKMKEIWTFMHKSFENSEKQLKKIRKSNHFRDYLAAVDEMFRLDLSK